MSILFFEKSNIDYGKNWSWFLLWGITLAILGLIAISLSVFTTLASVIILGALFLAGGIVTLIDTFQFWWKKSQGFYQNLTMGILYILLGILMLVKPVATAVSLTALLAIFFVIIGTFRIIFSLFTQLPRWGWIFLSGLITLFLGIYILSHLPLSGLFVIGLFIGIDLFFWGWAYIMIALFSRTSKHT